MEEEDIYKKLEKQKENYRASNYRPWFSKKTTTKKRIIAKLGISIYDRIQHSLKLTNLMKEGQGIREYTDVGQEGPNQSNNTSGRCSIFNAEFSRGLSLGRDSRARQAHTVTIAGRHRQWTCSSKNISKKHRYNSQEPIWVRLHCWVNKCECRCVF